MDNLEDNSVFNSAIEIKPRTPSEDAPEEKMNFDQLCECMTNFFDSRDFESARAFKFGYSSTVGEDYSNIDMLCNLSEIVYNYCCNNELSKTERRNMKMICNGTQQVLRGLQQFDRSVRMDNVLIAQMMGYILKITRNYFNDRHR